MAIEALQNKHRASRSWQWVLTFRGKKLSRLPCVCVSVGGLCARLMQMRTQKRNPVVAPPDWFSQRHKPQPAIAVCMFTNSRAQLFPTSQRLAWRCSVLEAGSVDTPKHETDNGSKAGWRRSLRKPPSPGFPSPQGLALEAGRELPQSPRFQCLDIQAQQLCNLVGKGGWG